MTTSTIRYAKPTPGRVRYSPLTWAVLTVLLVGPLVGPIFQEIGWPVLGLINWPLYLMGENVCPQPALTLDLFGYPMLICSRCWGGVFGLWAVLLAYKAWAGGAFWSAWRQMPEPAKISIALLCFAPWVLDIIAYDHGLWVSPHPFLLLTGLLGGLGAGALVLPVAAREARGV
ncbi:MAG: DUF2085 domain-containing protein [Chloroflexia bacterium]